MKSRLLNLFVMLGLIGSTFLMPAGMASAAVEWTCTSVVLNSGGGTNRHVTVTLSHSAADNERIDLNWGDGSPLLVVHNLTNPTNSTYLSNSQTHDYGNAAGVYNITMRVWAAGAQPPDSNSADWHQCGTTVTFSGCTDSGPTACKVTNLDGSRNVTSTVTYNLTAGQTAKIAWGDGVTTTLGSTAGLVTNQVTTHHYAGVASTFVVKLLIMTGSTVNVTCTLSTSNTPSDVTLSSMSAQSPADSINWTAIGFALLGLVVLGQLALFAVLKRR